MGAVIQLDDQRRHNEMQQQLKSLNLKKFLKDSKDGEVIGRYMAAFPMFSRMVKLLSSHVGFDISINGRPFMSLVLSKVVVDVANLSEECALENSDVSDLLIITLVKEVTELVSWSICVNILDDEDHCWDVSASSFSSWLRAAKETTFFVRRRVSASRESEKRGLAIRLLCFGLEDGFLGRITTKI